MRAIRLLNWLGFSFLLLTPRLVAGDMVISHRILTCGAQVGEAGNQRLVGSFGGLVMHLTSGGGWALTQGFWFPGQLHPSGIHAEAGPGFYFMLDQNHPNPFQSRTAISFTVPGTIESIPTRLDLFDVSGRLVRTLLDGKIRPGPHDLIWDGMDANGRSMTAGVYFARLRSGSQSTNRQLVFLK
jgi:hypothetical protein